MKDLTNIFKHMKVGTKFYSTVYGDVTFKGFEDGTYPIIMGTEDFSLVFTKYGKFYSNEDGEWYSNEDGECVLFPSKTQRDWNVYEDEERCKRFKDGDIIVDRSNGEDSVAIAILKGSFNNGEFSDYASIDYNTVLLYNDIKWHTTPKGWRLATEDEKQILFDRLLKDGKVWNAEKKCIEQATSGQEPTKNGELAESVTALINACRTTLDKLTSIPTLGIPQEELAALKELKEKLGKC